MNAATLIKLFESWDYEEFLLSLERINDTVSLYVACGLLAARKYDLVDALIQPGLMQVVYVIRDNLDTHIQQELDAVRYVALQVIAETAQTHENPLEWFVATYNGNLSQQDWVFIYNVLRRCM